MKRTLFFALALSALLSLSACSFIEDNLTAFGIIGGADGPTSIITTDTDPTDDPTTDPAAPLQATEKPIIHAMTGDQAQIHEADEIYPAWSTLHIPETDNTVGMAWMAYLAAGDTLDGPSLLSTWFGQSYCDIVYPVTNTAETAPAALHTMGNSSDSSDVYYVVPETYGTTLLVQIGDNEYNAISAPFFLVAGTGTKVFTTDADGNPDRDITPTTTQTGTTVLADGVENLSAYIALEESAPLLAPSDYLPTNVFHFAGDDAALASAYLQQAYDTVSSQIQEKLPDCFVDLSTSYYAVGEAGFGFEVEVSQTAVDTYRVYATLPTDATPFADDTADLHGAPFTVQTVTPIDPNAPTTAQAMQARVIASTSGGDATVQAWNAINCLAQTQITPVSGVLTLTPAQVTAYRVMLFGDTPLPAMPATIKTDATGNYLLPVLVLPAQAQQPAVHDFDFPQGTLTLRYQIGTAEFEGILQRHATSANGFAVQSVARLPQ